MHEGLQVHLMDIPSNIKKLFTSNNKDDIKIALEILGENFLNRYFTHYRFLWYRPNQGLAFQGNYEIGNTTYCIGSVAIWKN